jgi:hypothetical protein
MSLTSLSLQNIVNNILLKEQKDAYLSTLFENIYHIRTYHDTNIYVYCKSYEDAVLYLSKLYPARKARKINNYIDTSIYGGNCIFCGIDTCLHSELNDEEWYKLISIGLNLDAQNHHNEDEFIKKLEINII